MQGLRCVICRISGCVQGVGFRYSTAQQAAGLNLVGWVRNLPDGRVETEVCGPRNDIAVFLSWLEHGPGLAVVVGVETEDRPPVEYDDFAIR